MEATELTPELAELVHMARTLPPVLVRQLAEYAEFLNHKHITGPEEGRYLPVDYSDEWTDEDMRQATIAALRRFDTEHPDEDWGEDLSSHGGQPCSPPAT